jgi:4-amino-4-deoxychorismate lyase
MIVNGQPQQQIAIQDRAVQYGDGCFTTMAFRNGRLELFTAHIARLKLACAKLFIDFTKWSELEHCLVNCLDYKSNCVVKVIISRGQGGRGYCAQGTSDPSFIISQHLIPEHYSVWQKSGIKLTFSSITLARQPLLAGIKHLNRLEQVLIKHDLAKTDYDDAVVCDTQQNIIESSAGNLFWYKDNTWFTPDLSQSGVEGVMRNQVLAVMQEKGLDCQVVKQGVSVLFKAQYLFVCNALMGLIPVASLYDPQGQQSKNYQVQQIQELQQAVFQQINVEASEV